LQKSIKHYDLKSISQKFLNLNQVQHLDNIQLTLSFNGGKIQMSCLSKVPVESHH